MIGTAATSFDNNNPIDRVERLAERKEWAIDRTSDDEVLMSITGGWCDLHVSLSWRSDLESLFAAVAFDLKVPEKRQAEVLRLINQINGQMTHGHFDFWTFDCSIVFRNSLNLAGGAEVNDAQCEAMIHGGIDACQRYFPAVQFVIWAGHSAEDALASALLETQGEA